MVQPDGSDVAGRQWYYCGEPGCETVYFDTTGQMILKAALKVRVGEKEADPPHTVCYCFDHTVEEIEEDLARHGTTSIPGSIRAKVRAGECHYETMNPKGACCLGDVATVVKRATEATRSATDSPDHGATCEADAGGDSCCAALPEVSPEPQGEEPRRATMAALGLSALTALGASACCWLPLLLAALGASSVGVAATFEGMRPYLLVVAPLLLGFSFYMLYLRRTDCADGSSCATMRGSSSRAAKAFFWVAASLLVVSLAFPTAMAAILGGSGPTQDDGLVALPTLELRVEGMTCETCSANARSALRSIPGVVDAAADHERGTARIWFQKGTRPDPDALREALAAHGYRVVTVMDREPQGRHK